VIRTTCGFLPVEESVRQVCGLRWAEAWQVWPRRSRGSDQIFHPTIVDYRSPWHSPRFASTRDTSRLTPSVAEASES
jgi:hypothetical protein